MVVLVGTSLLGFTSGILGCFLLLRKRSLVSDAISHASLPGIGITFIILYAGGASISTLPLLIGAAITCLLALLCIQFFGKLSTLKEGTTIAVVLSALFGFGIFLLSIIQKLPTASASGINRFLYGKPASILFDDAVTIGVISLISLLTLFIFYRPIHVCIFDPLFARTLNYSSEKTDILLSVLTLGVILAGLQAVGIILIIAFLIIPAVSAQMWTKQLHFMIIIAGVFGLLSTIIGTLFSAQFTYAPAGSIIVLSSGFFFLLSILFGKRKGVIATARIIRFQQRTRNIQQFLRVWQDSIEHIAPDSQESIIKQIKQTSLTKEYILQRTGWSSLQFHKIIALVTRNKWTEKTPEYRLTTTGIRAALRVMRKHELYHFLIRHEPSLLHTFSHTKNMQEISPRTLLSTTTHQLLEEEHPVLFSPAVESVLGDQYV